MSDWRVDAACRGVSTSVFFPDAPNALAEARAICAGCSVQTDCLEFILSIGDEDDRAGVFAGLSARQRRAMRQERGIHPVEESVDDYVPIPLRWDSATQMYLVDTDLAQ